MQAIIYTRVSSDEQVKGTSLDFQEELCNKYCKEMAQIINGKKWDCSNDRIVYKEEKDMNKMPTLEAGMIIEMAVRMEMTVRDIDYKYLYIKDSYLINLNVFCIVLSINTSSLFPYIFETYFILLSFIRFFCI